MTKGYPCFRPNTKPILADAHHKPAHSAKKFRRSCDFRLQGAAMDYI